MSQHAAGDHAAELRHTPASRSDLPPRSFEQQTERMLDALRQAIRIRECSPKTELAHLAWAQRFLRFHGDVVDIPETLSASHARAFLEHLAHEERLAAGSRNQAASALSFLFRDVLGRDEMEDVTRARGPRRLPVVLTHREVLRVLRELTGKYFLIAVLLYSAGLRRSVSGSA
jgi:integrase